MAIIKITFDHPEASAPKHKFGERVALTDKCQPKDWLTGKVVGLTLEDTYEHRWWYAIKLDYPLGLTEEYLGHDLVTEQEIPMLQAQWETGEAVWVQESHSLRNEQKPSPEFQPGELVKFSKETGCNLMGDLAQVVSSRYVSSDDWSGWVYQLTNEHLTQSLEIGERWLELASPVAVTIGVLTKNRRKAV